MEYVFMSFSRAFSMLNVDPLTRKERWEGNLTQVLLSKPAEVVKEACQVLEKHGCSVEKELKSELYYSNTLLSSCVPSTALCQLDSGTCTNCIDCFNCTD